MRSGEADGEPGDDDDSRAKAARQEAWSVVNGPALTDANAFLKRYGLWSDGKRQF
jgi:post-segregation antitoxin (ccd killing protein)